MNCEQAQKQLSEFLDRMLNNEAARNLREHLAACPRCSEELAELAEGRRLVANLSALEPPVGLVPRVMADVRALASRPGVWERLFYPLRVKLPLQATAVLLVGVLSVYIFQKESVPVSPLDPAVPTQPPPQQEDAKSQDGGEPVSKSLSGKTVARAAKESKNNSPGSELPESKLADERKTPRSAASSAATTGRRLLPMRETQRSAPIPAQGVATGQERFSFPGEMRSRVPVAPIDALRSPGALPFPEERLFSIPRELIPDYEIVVRRRAIQRADQSAASQYNREASQKNQRNEGAPDSADARREAESPPLAKNRSTVEILWFSVPPDRYEDFKKELRAQSTIESETPVAVKEKDPSFIAGRPLSVKVTVFDTAEK